MSFGLFLSYIRISLAWGAYLLDLFQADLLNSNPTNLLILVLAGMLVVYVVVIFNKAQTLREREMLAAQAVREKELLATIRELREYDRQITERWLTSIETTSKDDNNAVRELASNIAAQTKQMEQLTAAINISIQTKSSGGSRRETKQ